MAATVAGVTLSATGVVAKADSTKVQSFGYPCLNHPWRMNQCFRSGRLYVRTMATTPESISDKVNESIKNAQETCASDPASGECVAAWDEVEELSAAASHIRLKQKEKDADPLEHFCKDNPETEECRTYED
ncbi:PREDICTED: calvin cycle protein CP12-1, chloroplastic-like [Nelumbo nucifera]|uniref:Calvin cycle protein CP12-1, chloroplastic-like n=1 Tax=Nelumbo nucifera TaxID=4432 RepID=A0A1U8AKZ7_NELNU|nr:PREDICTED: calvin cycle protein CP12-1, chloroplastic-like [Nelumbo nucifera]